MGCEAELLATRIGLHLCHWMATYCPLAVTRSVSRSNSSSTRCWKCVEASHVASSIGSAPPAALRPRRRLGFGRWRLGHAAPPPSPVLDLRRQRRPGELLLGNAEGLRQAAQRSPRGRDRTPLVVID